MIRQIRLKRQLAAILLTLGALLVGGYSLLAAHYFKLGMDSTMVGAMEQAVHQHIRQRAKGTAEPDLGAFTVTSTWQQQPRQIRSLLPQPPQQETRLVTSRETKPNGRRGRLVFAMRFPTAEGTLFVSHTLTRQQMSSLVHRTIRDNLTSLLLISLSTAVALALAIWLLLRQLSKPVARLGRWARDLESANLQDPLPDFRYPELNELASLVRDSLSSQQDSLEREHRFLRHSSHELRTPISVMRSGIELIRSLPPEQAPAARSVLASIIDRLDRASLNMKHLTETLLWLSRDEPIDLPTRPIALDQLVQNIVEEHRYLLRDKDVALSVTTSPATLEQSEVALRMVLGNLIRNAFQHTWAGDVTLRQQGKTIFIDNLQRADGLENGSGDSQDADHDAPAGHPDTVDDLGFGLGLELTAQLTERLGWHYHNQPVPGGHYVQLTLVDAAEPHG
ncbi:sensor histidine kinase [Halomonas denitrificans]|uniref:sensor histidine kinase n=1 Tax=Halomonas denitrificans TaxID=370769 RepID=UPI001C999283|nr:HAMP domain-containing sensor histidine kinase [Halomonas denitrificans]MBY5968917.1 HAMP domain-containing histidine kinase [Halomonas denitrificans]